MMKLMFIGIAWTYLCDFVSRNKKIFMNVLCRNRRVRACECIWIAVVKQMTSNGAKNIFHNCSVSLHSTPCMLAICNVVKKKTKQRKWREIYFQCCCLLIDAEKKATCVTCHPHMFNRSQNWKLSDAPLDCCRLQGCAYGMWEFPIEGEKRVRHLFWVLYFPDISIQNPFRKCQKFTSDQLNLNRLLPVIPNRFKSPHKHCE